MLERALKHAPVARRMQMMHGILSSFEAVAGLNDAFASTRNESELVRFDA